MWTGVLGDFSGHVIARINTTFGTLFTPDELPCEYFTHHPKFYQYRQIVENEWMHEENFVMSIPPRPGSKEFVEAARGLGDVFMVTSPSHTRHWVYERSEWLKLHFGIDRSNIIQTSAKSKVCGDILVEDRADTLRLWWARQSRNFRHSVSNVKRCHLVKHAYNRRDWEGPYSAHSDFGSILRAMTALVSGRD